MRYEFAYVGIPREFYDRVYSKRDTFLGGAGFFGEPVGRAGYNKDSVGRLVDHFSKLIVRDHHNSLSDTSFAVIAIRYDDDSMRLLVESTFPSIYCASVAWSPQWGAQMAMNRSANELIDLLRTATNRAKAALSHLGDELVSRSNSTPLLLPLKNFSSSTVVDELRRLHEQIAAADNHDELIQGAVNRIKKAHPFDRVGESQKRVYMDDREVVYASPGRDRHAFARPGNGHSAECVLSGKRRLGAPYDHAFHYDCTKESQSQLRGSFFGCHDPAAERVGNPHLNIAPNDFVR